MHALIGIMHSNPDVRTWDQQQPHQVALPQFECMSTVQICSLEYRKYKKAKLNCLTSAELQLTIQQSKKTKVRIGAPPEHSP